MIAVKTLLARTMPRGCRRALSTARRNVPAVGAWGDLARCSRAVRVGDHVTVAGTCAPGDTAGEQVRNIFAVIEPALEELGLGLGDVVLTRMFAADIERDWEELGAAHAGVFERAGDQAKPACTLVGGALLMPWMKGEVEVQAIASPNR